MSYLIRALFSSVMLLIKKALTGSLSAQSVLQNDTAAYKYLFAFEYSLVFEITVSSDN